ncbi:RHS repeat domain-containing protein [Paraburkholderia sp. J67]|uniref:RHS repeat domain-containing protein n=1 Tax=Paraburkholderia sp. J67 TaxID=2805435 RepID=UPI0039F4E3EB
MKAYHYATDHLGTPQEVYDEKRQIVWAADLSAYGKTRGYLKHEIDNPIRLPGQYFDTESGLHYNRFRYYDPQSGRYVNQDPIGLKGGVNFYQYAESAPTHYVDSQGLASCSYSIAGGRLRCTPSDPQHAPVDIPVASGNNGAGMQCKNNPQCISNANRGPIPTGHWRWNINGPGASNSKPNGRRLVPQPGTTTYGRGGFLTHSCLNAFGPSLGPQFCSEGCVTGSSSNMQTLNSLLDAEPDSTLEVTP